MHLGCNDGRDCISHYRAELNLPDEQVEELLERLFPESYSVAEWYPQSLDSSKLRQTRAKVICSIPNLQFPESPAVSAQLENIFC